VIRWMVVIFLVLVIVSLFTSVLQKLGIGKLPGDIRFHAFGREWFLPVTTTLLLSGLASLIARYW